MSFTLGDKAAKQVAEVIKAYNSEPGKVAGQTSWGRAVRPEYSVYGKLDGTMARNGTATLSIYKPSTTGGIGTDTLLNVTIIDVGMTPSAVSPLPANAVVKAEYSRGAWVIGAYDCDAV